MGKVPPLKVAACWAISFSPLVLASQSSVSVNWVRSKVLARKKQLPWSGTCKGFFLNGQGGDIWRCQSNVLQKYWLKSVFRQNLGKVDVRFPSSLLYEVALNLWKENISKLRVQSPDTAPACIDSEFSCWCHSLRHRSRSSFVAISCHGMRHLGAGCRIFSNNF